MNLQRPFPDNVLFCIFQQFPDNDAGEDALCSCTLVNRQWFSIAAKLYWRRPFSSTSKTKRGMVSVRAFLSLLNSVERREIPVKLLLPEKWTNPTIAYPSYVKDLDICGLIHDVYEWLWLQLDKLLPKKRVMVIYSSVHAILKMLKRYSVNLNTLIIHKTDFLHEVDDILQVLLDPEIHELVLPIRSLRVYVNAYWNMKVATPILSLVNDCKFITQFSISIERTKHTPRLLTKFIRTHPGFEVLRLRLFFIYEARAFKQIVSTIAFHSKTLRHLELAWIDFCGSGPLHMIAACQQLEILKIMMCRKISAKAAEPLINAKFPCLKSVEVSGCDCPELEQWAQIVNERNCKDLL
ncbi:5453_t:CDS:2 [Paraglomus occultum]|uniref:5453_t:CDS:1 n=1 Tax=Paraglomus occultum TaxID=144539 RepID=A0A9N9BIX5_9GLOM|nr:5453_t:CDS:2 [Paraglomus occultum]